MRIKKHHRYTQCEYTGDFFVRLLRGLFGLCGQQGCYGIAEFLGGLRWVEEPSSLRFFFGRLEPTSDWQEKLVKKFRDDFGDSL